MESPIKTRDLLERKKCDRAGTRFPCLQPCASQEGRDVPEQRVDLFPLVFTEKFAL